jgi:TRAP-type C4-dicarboxylate transport system permease small subunit
MNPFFKAIHWISEGLRIMGLWCLVGMMLLTCVDVVGRKFGHPIFGSVELVGFMATLAVAFALPYTHQAGAHIGVEVLVQLLSPRAQAVIELCTHAVSLVLFAVVTWQMALYADTIHKSGTVSMSLELPEHVIIYIVAVCFLLFTLVIIKDIVANVQKLRGPR